METSNLYMPPEYQEKHLVEGFSEDRSGFISPDKTGTLLPCSVDKTRICNYPHTCCLKKITLVPLTDEEYQTLPKLFAVKDTTSWNVVHWNKAIPETSFTIPCKDEQEARERYNVLTKMSSTWAAMLRQGTKQIAGYVWML